MDKDSIFEIELPKDCLVVLNEKQNNAIRLNWKDLDKLNKKLIKIYNKVQIDYYAKKNDEGE